jgi:hypothetical protein
MTKRQHIRELKRAVSRQRNAEAMHALLQRSVRFGHKRLALLRCMQAEQMGIDVAPDLLAYCRQVADQMPVSVLENIVMQAGRGMAHAPKPEERSHG